jgi:transcriptional regulator with XRE-family HTH domain
MKADQELIHSFMYWVRRRRKALDLTQAGLAQAVGCALVTLKKIEWDERRPSPPMAERLADCLDIPATEKDRFLRLARGEFVTVTLSPSAGSVSSPLPLLPAALSSRSSPYDWGEAPQIGAFYGRQAELAELARWLVAASAAWWPSWAWAAKEYVRQAQVRLILQPIAERLVAHLGRAGVETKLKQLLTTLRQEAPLSPGCAGGNILNLLVHLGGEVGGYDFSG